MDEEKIKGTRRTAERRGVATDLLFRGATHVLYREVERAKGGKRKKKSGRAFVEL